MNAKLAGGPLNAALMVLLVLVLAACGGEPHGPPIRFTVPKGSGLAAIADTLDARGVIDSALRFRAYARVQGEGRAIRPGVYEVRAGEAWSTILRKLVTGDVVKLTIVVPEGWTAEQIAARIASSTGASPDTVRALVLGDSAAARYGVPGPTLEGYLYPATYVVPFGTPPAEIVGGMVSRYRKAWTPDLRARADSAGLSEREVVTLASIVEKEAKRWGERDTIAAVYRNRLRIGMPLQADPTVQYALGQHQSRLLYSQIRSVADHPYNTYTHRGLPPGPIASPSAGAIEAVLRPAPVDYLYFVAQPDGSHVFSHSLAQHNAAKQRAARGRADSTRATAR